MKAYKIYDGDLNFYDLAYIIYNFDISSTIASLEKLLLRKGRVYDYHEEAPNIFKISFENEEVWYAKEYVIEPGLVMQM